MSTKNLARTVIEGGRTAGNRWARRHSNAQDRVREHQISTTLLTRVELDDATYPPRTKVYKWFNDKLSPAERWLGKNVGRPWGRVRSELLRQFDTRTTAGRHIVFDHLLPSVESGPDRLRRRDFVVDRHGILRRVAVKARTAWHFRLGVQPVPEEVKNWMSGRRVGERGTQLFWFTPTPAGLFRQDRRLEEEDAIRFRALPKEIREQLDAFGARPEAATE